MHAGDACIQAMSAQPDIHMLRALLGNQLRKCAALKLMFMSIDGPSPFFTEGNTSIFMILLIAKSIAEERRLFGYSSPTVPLLC